MKLEKTNTKPTIEFEDSTGNIFADLGLENPDQLLAKSTLIIRIRRVMEARGLTEVAAARMFKVNRADLAAALQGNLDRFSASELKAFFRSTECRAMTHDNIKQSIRE